MNKLKGKIPVILFLCIAGIFIFQLCGSKEKKMDLLFRQFNNEDAPSASVMVIKEGEILFNKSYGLADIKRKIPANENTNYRIGCMTKAFTTMSIMMLKEKGLLTYETTLKDIFPDFCDYGNRITIKNLLEHESGLIDYYDLIPKDQKEQLKDEDVLNLYKEKNRLICEPGTKFGACDAEYSLLAMVVEKVSGVRFAKFLETNIFKPLEMNHTVAYEKGISTIENRAYGATKVDGKYVECDQSITSAVLGDGGIYTSIGDYYKWDQALYTDKLVSYDTLKEIFDGGSGDGYGDIMGYGWFHYYSRGRKVMGYYGGSCGFGSGVIRIPSEKLTAVVLSNYNTPDDYIDMYSKYMKQIADIYTNL